MGKNEKLRAPIVTVLGHVDHGKTTLLDYIRRTNTAKKEIGGITQSIGASLVKTPEGKKITFIDTPGHAAFANMRSRGAKVADIAILVVAADDGVKPQTKEALEYVLASGTPFIVAVTKIDLPHVSIEIVRGQLEKEGIQFEGRGGDVPIVGVSGITGQGVGELLELITLVSELNSVKGNPESDLEAVVIETSKEKLGPTVTVVVRNGSITVGDYLMSEKTEAKVRGLFDYLGSKVSKVNPGEPVKISGFAELPDIGSRVWRRGGQVPALEQSGKKEIAKVETEEGKIALLIKAKNTGSLEAILTNLPEDVSVTSSGIGDVTESDVFTAKATSAKILAFESKIPATVSKLAETEGVSVETFNIIYRLFEKVEELVKKEEIEILGQAEIIAFFPYDGKRVSGCKITIGKISSKDRLYLKREDKKIGEVKILSMKKGKQDILEAKQGEECGILFVPQLDFKVSDVLISVRK